MKKNIQIAVQEKLFINQRERERETDRERDRRTEREREKNSLEYLIFFLHQISSNVVKKHIFPPRVIVM